MSECVVQMEMPTSCGLCDLRKKCKAYSHYAWQIAEAAPIRPEPFPLCDGCLFVCQLPEGHGRLIDASTVIDAIRVEDLIRTCKVPTIVPAERREI